MPHSPFIQISMNHDFHHIGILHPLTHQKRSAKFSGILHKKIHDLHTSSPSFSRRNGLPFPHGFSHLGSRSSCTKRGARRPGSQVASAGAARAPRRSWGNWAPRMENHHVFSWFSWLHHGTTSGLVSCASCRIFSQLILVVGTKWVINDGLILFARTLWPILVGNGS